MFALGYCGAETMPANTSRRRLSAFGTSLFAGALLAGAAVADPMADMPGMGGHGGMMMGPMLGPMPAIYAGEADKPGAPVFKGLGAHRHPISTKNPATQRFFDQGVNLLFGFNHAEAIRSFREAARLDPDCAMCWWGVAVRARARTSTCRCPTTRWRRPGGRCSGARRWRPRPSPEERAWIEALAVRYSTDPKADRHALDEASPRPWAALWRAYPDDLDAGTFYAEAMMDTQPWDYWQLDGKTPKGHARRSSRRSRASSAASPTIPGALHLYIHAVEATTTPERAEAAADRLERLMPGAGHIVHMPSHIYYRVGRYEDAARVNELAAKVDEAYIAACKRPGLLPGRLLRPQHPLPVDLVGDAGPLSGGARRRAAAGQGGGCRSAWPGQVPHGRSSTRSRRSPPSCASSEWDAVLAEPPPPKELLARPRRAGSTPAGPPSPPRAI